MEWFFRPKRPEEKAREPIQGEFFSTEAIKNPAEALVREGIQNSLDAALRDDQGRLKDTVRVRIMLATGKDAIPAKALLPWLKGAWPHINAESNGLREQPTEKDDCNYLLFEDFNTSGLTGDEAAVDVKPTARNAFYYFYRAEGRSGKGQQDRGRWGVGKHVFPRSSGISTFFGVTVRADDQRQLMMGTCVLKTHDVDGQRYSPDAWFGEPQTDGPVLPIETKVHIDAFKRLFRITRDKESGLSLVVPFVDPAFTLYNIVEAVLDGFFAPIMSLDLEVTVEWSGTSVPINAGTLKQVVESRGSAFAVALLPLIDLTKWAVDRNKADHLQLTPEKKLKPEWTAAMWPPGLIEKARSALETDKRLAFQVNLQVQEKHKNVQETNFGVYLWQDGFENGKPVFIREGLIISNVRCQLTRGIRSLVRIEDRPIATALGDSENPAHTEWQATSSNFKDKYENGAALLKFVKQSVGAIVAALRTEEGKEDLSVLLDVFSIPDPEGVEVPGEFEPDDAEKGTKTEPPERTIEPTKKRYRLGKTSGGFTVTPGEVPIRRPAIFDIRVAYDRRRGNPLSKYHVEDFEIGKGGVKVKKEDGLKVTSTTENHMRVELLADQFNLAVGGFDERRDVYVKVKLLEVE